MKKRLQAILAAFMVVFLLFVDCTPVAGAVAPIALVEAALASYVISTGYKLYNDQGTASDLMSALNNLYDSWLETLPAQTASALVLANIATIQSVFLDNQNNIVIRQSVASHWQDFAEWIQSNYSVPVGSSSPTVVISPSGGNTFNNTYYGSASASDHFFRTYTTPVEAFNIYTFGYELRDGTERYEFYYTGPNNHLFMIYTGFSQLYYQIYVGPEPFTVSYRITTYSSQAPYVDIGTIESQSGTTKDGHAFYFAGRARDAASYKNASFPNISTTATGNYINYTVEEYANDMYMFVFGDGSYQVGSLASNLAVSLAHAVADVVGSAAQDDSVVLDVGASAFDTPAEVADIIASGVKAQTLEPAVSIVADAVIDTPVQSYPDVDNLGLPELGLALVERFPFCIPYDFVHLISIFEEEPEAPYISIDIFPDAFKQKLGITGNTAFVIDLGSETWAWIGTVSRWASLIGFCLIMFTLTKRLIWTS